ncbi:MAG: hypothetical protein ACRDDY_03220, partial [Clostridium sp.]|uniref:hypothetical protein n=1 Tax=Clostridium sp. TaxID=1506 RepID=UPI003EE66C6B
MEENMIKINGTLMEMSSNEGGDLVGKFLVCPLDEGNDNKVGLRKEDLSEVELLGLKNKALVTKVVTNKDGELDFSGHNRKIKTVVKDGVVCNEVEFDTSGVGFHSNVYIEELTLPNGLIKECIVAEAIIWNRYEKVCSVIERLGTSLKTSWEIAYGECYFENGIKWLKNISWLGNCLLGSNVRPAYKDAGMLEVAEEDGLSLEVAFAEDILNIENENGGKEMDNEKNLEIAQLSMSDLESRIRRAIYATEGDGRWYYGILIYPLDNVAYAKLEKCGDSKTEDYTKFTYSVNSDDTVSITAQQDVKMVFVPVETIETEIANKDQEIAEVKADLAKKETEVSEGADKIIKLGETIAEKDSVIAEKEAVIAELEPFKAQVEEMNKVKEQAELAEKKEALKIRALASFTEEEIELSEDLKGAIEN